MTGYPALNVVAVCNHDRTFQMVAFNSPGSVCDNTVINDQRMLDAVPDGYFWLCDAGGALSMKLLTPYLRTRYHLNEFNGAARHRVVTTEKEYLNHMCVLY